DEKTIDNLVNSIIFFKANSIVLATGGPAILYRDSVYPESQKGTIGIAIEAGCKLQNLTESQFGLASMKFRWNLSGSYQQVIPRYFSIDDKGREIEFLNNYFPSFKKLSKAIFLKGYQWPFNVERIENYGSSLIDLAVYNEVEILGRRVFLDFKRNPSNFNFNKLDDIAKNYLIKSNAIGDTPIERLKAMNERAIKVFLNNKIDITKERVQIAVCNQHLNGGIYGDIWWETNIENLYAIGEINGSHGIHRPGGAALNSGQIGGLRAAQKINYKYNKNNTITSQTFIKIAKKHLDYFINELEIVLTKNKNIDEKGQSPSQILLKIQEIMAKYCTIVRPLKGLKSQIEKIKKLLENFPKIVYLKNNKEIIDFLRVKDALLTQFIILNSIYNYHQINGSSRGSYLILRDNLIKSMNERYIIPHDNLEHFKFIVSQNTFKKKIQTVYYQNGEIKIIWEPVKQIPEDFGWFETVWKDFIDKNYFLQ
ncbi:MAG: FAD-binding protein, partial [Promethearchaeota archaeon]